MESKPKTFTQAFEELEKLTDGQGRNFKDKITAEMAGLEEQINRLKPQLEELRQKAREELGKTKDRVETQVKENPWVALGIVGLICLVIGWLLSGSRRSR